MSYVYKVQYQEYWTHEAFRLISQESFAREISNKAHKGAVPAPAGETT